MIGQAPRVAWLMATDDGLSIGDPGREHVTLTHDGAVHVKPDPGDGSLVEVEHWGWEDITQVKVSADTTSRHKPGGRAFLLSALSEAMGWASNLSDAPVDVMITGADGTSTEVLADGFAGKAYFKSDDAKARAVIDSLVTGDTDRSALADASRLLSGQVSR